MALLIMGGILPAIFLVEIGEAFRPTPDQPERSTSWTGYLLVANALLVGTIEISYNLGEQASLVVLLLLPSALAAFIQATFWLFHSRLADVRRSWILAMLLLANLALLALIIPLTDPFIGSIMLIGGGLLALTRAAWDRLNRAWGLVYFLTITLGAYSGWRIDASRELISGIPWLERFGGILAYLVIMLEVLVLFKLLEWASQPERQPDWPRVMATILLALPMLGLAAWQIATASAWDVATDGLGGIATLQLTGVAGIAAAALSAWRQPAKHRTPFFILGLALPLYMMAWMSFGTYGLDGAWGNVPHARTERRAATIERAIQRYHARTGAYPGTLQELTPGTLLFLPTPFIIPGQDWCYQGGANYYRLGFVTRKFFSAPGSVQVFSSAGTPPDPAWPCDDEAARYPAPPGFYDEQ